MEDVGDERVTGLIEVLEPLCCLPISGPPEGGQGVVISTGQAKADEVVSHWSFRTSFVSQKARLVAFHEEMGWVERVSEERTGIYHDI